MEQQNYYNRLKENLSQKLQPSHLEIIDESYKHVGHAGYITANGETHFKITISSPLFKDKTKIACHRLVNEAIKDELAEHVHAVEIRVLKKN